MIVIKPVTITSPMFTSSIAEPDTGETVWTAGTYTIGTRKINTTTHRIYEVVATSTSDDPLVGIVANPPTWIDVGPTNKWAMLDGVVGNQSTAADEITVSFETGTLVNGLAVFGMSGVSDAVVTVTDPVAGEVYNREVELVDNSMIDGWYSYLFEDIVRKDQFVLTDLPAYRNATIEVVFSGTDEIGVGEVVLGKQISLGVAVYGTGMQLLDFSVANTDEFGNFTNVTRRRFSKLVDFDVRIEKPRINFVFQQLSELRATPAVWIGEGTEDDATLVYGYYRNNQINIDTPSYCSATIQVQGLI